MDKFAALKREGKLTGSIKAAKAKRAAREKSRNVTLRMSARQRRIHAIQLGDWASYAVERAQAEHPRRRNWHGPSASTSRTVAFAVKEHNLGRYSRRCTWTHYTYEPILQSYGYIYRGELVVRIAGHRARFKAPRGYRWGEDFIGLKLVSIARPADDYHPTASELISVDGKTCSVLAIRSKLIRLATLRRKLAREEKADARRKREILERARREGAMVCLRDSLRAGNCLGGTTTWCRNHGLDVASHIAPLDLLARANGDASRVGLVVASALRRHEQEMRQGYCLLADHRS